MLRSVFAAAVFVVGCGVLAAPVANAVPYKNCTQARKNGDTDIPSTSDKYGPWLDRDGDGIACES